MSNRTWDQFMSVEIQAKLKRHLWFGGSWADGPDYNDMSPTGLARSKKVLEDYQASEEGRLSLGSRPIWARISIQLIDEVFTWWKEYQDHGILPDLRMQDHLRRANERRVPLDQVDLLIKDRGLPLSERGKDDFIEHLQEFDLLGLLTAEDLDGSKVPPPPTVAEMTSWWGITEEALQMERDAKAPIPVWNAGRRPIPSAERLQEICDRANAATEAKYKKRLG